MNRRRFLHAAALSLPVLAGPSCSRRGGGGGEGDSDSGLEVMSFNIRYRQKKDGDNYWDNRVGAVAGMIREWNPAVIGMQEAERPMLDDLRPGLSEWSELGVGRTDGVTQGEYCAILYRSDVVVPLESGTFWLSDTPEVAGSRTWGPVLPRICTWARFRHQGTGRNFYFYNTHLDNAVEDARKKGARLIAERIGARAHPDPFLLTGDFNSGEGSDPIEFFLGKAADSTLTLIDTFRAVHPDKSPAGTIHGWSGRLDSARIDYIFASPGSGVRDADILSYQVDGRWPSDHYPIRARVDLASA